MSKISDLKERYPEMNINLIELFAKHDPTNTNKYLEYMVKGSQKFVKTELIMALDEVFKELFDTIEKFEKYQSLPIITNKDVNAYTIEELSKTVKEAEKYKSDSIIKSKETIKVYQDEKVTIVIPLTYDSSKLYGANTRWCTTMNGGAQFSSHAGSGVLIYAMLNDINVPEKYKKIAWFVQKKGEAKYGGTNITIWDTTDEKIIGFTDIYRLTYEYLPKTATTKLAAIIDKIEAKGYKTAQNAKELAQFAM